MSDLNNTQNNTNAPVIKQDLTDMSNIVNNNICATSISNSQDSTNQLKLFLIAQAKNELNRIIKLLAYLDIVEDKFISVSTDLMNEYPDNISLVSDTMKVLMNCITRSNELISQIVSNDKLNSFIIPQIKEVSETDGLTLESRNKIRDLTNLVLAKLNSDTTAQ